MATGEHAALRSRNGDPNKVLYSSLQPEHRAESDQFNLKNLQSQHQPTFATEAQWLSFNGNLELSNARIAAAISAKTPHTDLLDEQIRGIDPADLDVGEEDHPLEHGYTLWFSKQIGSNNNKNFEESLKILVTFKSVERFWRHYIHLRFAHELSGHCDYHLFKYGIKPMWEDPANRDGGKWILRVRKSIASRVWENVILAILGEQFLVGDEICGAVLSVRYSQDSTISVWNRTADDMSVRTKIMETLRRVANLPLHDSLEYKRHNKALSDRRPHRNAEETVPR